MMKTLLTCLSLLAALSANAQTIAITCGTVHTAAGPAINNGTVLIRDGRIVAVGTAVDIPADAVRVDATGRWVTPGLIVLGSQVGLVEIGSVPGTREGSYSGSDVSAAFSGPCAVSVPTVASFAISSPSVNTVDAVAVAPFHSTTCVSASVTTSAVAPHSVETVPTTVPAGTVAGCAMSCCSTSASRLRVTARRVSSSG